MPRRPPQSPTSPEVVDAIERAFRLAMDNQHEMVTLEHLLAAVLEQDDVKSCLLALDVDHEAIRSDLEAFFEIDILPSATVDAQPSMTDAVQHVISAAVGTARFSPRGAAKPIDLLLQILRQPVDDSHACTLLLKYDLTELAVKRQISHGSDVTREVAEGEVPTPEKDVADLDGAQKILAKFCVNLNERAKDARIDPLIGREDEVQRIVEIVARRTKNNVALVGEAGVGKTAVVEGLALKIVRGEVPEIIATSTVYALDIGNLLAGTRFRGDLEERMKLVLKALTFVENAILFIDEIHMIMGAGSGNTGAMDVANLLKPALSKGELRCIGATTNEEFRTHFEKDRALLRRFKRLDIYEPTIADTKLILRGLKPYYEAHHGVVYTDAALDACVDLTARYVSKGFLPDKAIDMMDAAGAVQRATPVEKRTTTIDVALIEREVGKVAKIPETTVAEDEGEKMVRLEEELRSTVFGQNGALDELADAVRISRAGLREPNKPSGSYLFTGPTGVGKTESARALAKVLNVPLIKYDMSEYMEKHAVSKLIGAPPGYVGYGDGDAGSGKLVNDVDENPYCVLLLDEIEKAHPDVFNVLLQIMDDGKLTASNGKTVDFRNVVLIMTSNAGAAAMERSPLGFGAEARTGEDDVAIKKMFSPEFRNRLDAVVKFDKLSAENVRRVVVKFIDQLRSMVAARGVEIAISDAAVDWLAKTGYDPAMGARPLGRIITNSIKKPLSKLLLTTHKTGGVVHVSIEDDKIVLA